MPVDEADASPLAVAPARAVGSDPHDFAGLYVRHRASFTAHARRYLRDQRDADEVVQEAFLRLFLALPELDTELQALAYCRRTITNLCIDRYRAQARRPYLVDLDTAHVEDLADDDPGDPVVRAEDAALVRSALSLLSPLQRAALVKREVEDKSLPVIAGELDIPEDNVKHLLFRARRALRKLLAGSSLAPGGDADARGLGLAAKAGSRSLATLLVLLVLGLGSGPDLEAIPVVGRDLPDVIGVTEMAETLRGVVSGVGERIAPSGGAGTSSVGAGRLESALSAPLVDRAAEAAAQRGRGEAAAGSSAGGAVLTGTVVLPAGSAPAGASAQASAPGSSAAQSSSTVAADRAGVAPVVRTDVPIASDRPAVATTAPAPGAGSAAPGESGRGTGAVVPGPVTTPSQPPSALDKPGRAVVPPAAARPAAPAGKPAAQPEKAADKAEKAAAKAKPPAAAPALTATAAPEPAAAEPAPAAASEPVAAQAGASTSATP